MWRAPNFSWDAIGIGGDEQPLLSPPTDDERGLPESPAPDEPALPEPALPERATDDEPRSPGAPAHGADL